MYDWHDFFSRIPMMPDEYYASAHYEKMVSFSFANAASVDQVQYIQDQLVDVYSHGGTFNDFKKLARKGDLALTLPNYRLENIFRTNIMTAYGRGSYLEQMSSAKLFQYGKYVAIKDSATRKNHRALDGIIVEVGSKLYDLIYPPNGYQCRCFMQMITEQQAIRERKYSDAEVERIIAANPPDKGFEGPPFYGDELVMPPEMTEKQMLEFLDTGRTESESNYLKYMKQLEMEGDKADDVTKDKARAIPNVVVDAKKQQMKVNLDAYMRETLKSAKTPLHRTARIEMTPEDEALKKSLGKDFTNALKEMGLIDKATTSAKNKAIKDILYDIFNKMSKSDKYYSRTADEAWNRLIEAASQVEEMTRAPQFYNKDYMRYSAGMMRYLTTEERALMSLYTTNGASYISNASRLGRDSAEYKAMKKYLDVVDRLYEVTEQYVERKPVLLHRGVGVHDDWTDKIHPEKPTTLIDVFKNWKPGEKDTFKFDLPTSFSEDNEVARMFAEDSAIQHFNVGVTFNLVTNRSMPVSSVSIHRNEAEHIMRQGEKYRIVNVEKVNETYISWKVDIEHIGRDESVDYEFTLV